MRQKVYSKLYDLEDELMDSLKESLSAQSDESMSALESLLQASLNTLFRQDKKKILEQELEHEKEEIEVDEVSNQPIEYEEVVYTPIKSKSNKPKTKPKGGTGIRFVHSKELQNDSKMETQVSVYLFLMDTCKSDKEYTTCICTAEFCCGQGNIL
mmetsp:Transcript_6313/g.7954  ORF Transcript_6313/g.7954 Transcript_6313/m.7954 type:complete len:155 (+) Transcript_6313:371-835(+)